MLKKSLPFQRATKMFSTDGSQIPEVLSPFFQMNLNDLQEEPIIYHLKKDQLEFFEDTKGKDLIKKHSMSIGFPVELMVEKSTDKEVNDSEDED
jgi:hypothetical protein